MTQSLQETSDTRPSAPGGGIKLTVSGNPCGRLCKERCRIRSRKVDRVCRYNSPVGNPAVTVTYGGDGFTTATIAPALSRYRSSKAVCTPL